MIIKKYRNVDVFFHIKKEDINSTNLIYLLKFPNGQYYVGQTASKYGLSNRIRQHCCEAFTAIKKTNMHKNNIIQKYKKIDVFILHKCDTIEEIDDYEVFYIDILKRKIVNLESGGNINKKLSNETKEKIRNSNNMPDKKKYGCVEVYNLGNNIALGTK